MGKSEWMMVATVAVTAAAVTMLRWLARLNDHSTTLSARRRAGVLQLSKWGVFVLGCVAIVGELLVAVGASPATLAVIAAAGTSGIAFALREPIADFLAAVAFLIERVGAVGDEVELNGNVSGTLVGFGLRSVVVRTHEGDLVFHTASAIRTFRNVSVGTSRAVVDIDIPSSVRTHRATAVLVKALARERDATWRTDPEVLGVVAQFLDRYVLRVTCLVDPAQHHAAQLRLKAAAVDAVAEMLEEEHVDMPTEELLIVFDDSDKPEALDGLA